MGKWAKGRHLNSVYFSVSCKVQRLTGFGFKLHTGKTAIRKLKSRRNKAKCRERTKLIAEFRQLFPCRKNICTSTKMNFLENKTFWNTCSEPWPFTNNCWASQPLNFLFFFFLCWFATAILVKMDGNLDDAWGSKSQPQLLVLKNTFTQGLLTVTKKSVLLIMQIAFSDLKIHY